MLWTLRMLGTVSLGGALLGAVMACASGERHGASTAPLAEAHPMRDVAPQPSAPPQPATPAAQEQAQTTSGTPQAEEKPAPPPEQKAKQDAEKAKQEAKQARERERKRVKLQRDLEVARLRLEKLKLDHEHAQLKFDESAAKAQVELELTQKKLADFKQILAPNRVARSELGLASGEDNLREAREELEQLELMYSEEQFADKTKEIVIGRARRRLERTQRDVELRREEHQTLVEITLPRETFEQELTLQDKERSLAQLRRDEASAKLERPIALLNADAEIERLQNELADVEEEIKEAQTKPAAGAGP